MLSDFDLLGYSEQHLNHEINMLFRTGTAFEQLPSDGVIKDALIESFATHTRNLINFFYDKNPHGNDVVAELFMADPTEWKNKILPKISETLVDAQQRANKQIAHLTILRIGGAPPEK